MRGGSDDRTSTYTAGAAAPVGTVEIDWLGAACGVAADRHVHPLSVVGLIWVIVDAPRLGYRRHDALFVLIPIYGPFVFLPKMAWRIGHKDRPYWPKRYAR
jgi:hypothetical protein